jgi:hypothetical protein
MAHRSRKKHLKHVHEHEPATPPAKSPTAKAEAAAAGIAKKGGSTRRAPELKTEARRGTKKKGIVRRLAATATKPVKKLAKKPRKILEKAKARVEKRVKALLD